MSRSGNLTMWQNGLNWMEDDEDQDSDTDSKLSGSAIVDNVMKQLRSHGHRKGHFEFSDSLNHQIREQDEEEEEGAASGSHTQSSVVSNGYRDMSGASAGRNRQGLPRHQSPGHLRRNVPMSVGASASKNYYPSSGGSGVRKDILSPVPETYSGARVVDMTIGPPMSPSSVVSSTVTSQGGAPRSGFSGRNWAGARSMEGLHHTPPQSRREAPPYRPPPMDGLNSRSHEALHKHSHSPPIISSSYTPSSYLQQDVDTISDVSAPPYSRAGLGSHGNNFSSGGGMGPGKAVSSQFYSSKSHSPGHVSGSNSHSANMTSPTHGYSGSQFRTTTPTSARTPPVRRANYERSDGHTPRHAHSAHTTPHHHLLADHASPSRPHAALSREPNLNDVVDFLSSGDAGLVANAASYLQHLAYGDDSMKAKIRQFGAIPALICQLRNEDTKVVVPVLGALRNLSFGRINDENKLNIVREQGLEELTMALKMFRISEVRELITSVLWNISSCENVKINVIQLCVQDLVDFVLVPYSGWNWDIARDPFAKPTLVKWNAELRNVTGILRNISSAGEGARVYMRQVNGLVDSLLWLSKAAVQNRQGADDKTVENVMCVLRNLSYQLESEVDLQDGAEDVLDPQWEAEQRKELAEVSGRNRPKKSSTPGCLAMCTRPKTSDSARHASSPPTSAAAGSQRPYVSRPSIVVDFANPDPSVFPKKNRQVQGMALLWQPEVVFPYLATLDLYNGCADTLEAAAGTIQNITACSWKWAVYARNMIRACTGLKVIAELLNNGHDAVVRAGATALRNLATDARNKASLGSLVIPATVPRLPFGSNHLGISESTTVALLVLLMEMCTHSPDNARLFREKDGIPYLTRLSRSRQHTTKIVFAANKICSILHNYKECKVSLKRDGWEMSTFLRMQREYAGQFEFESAGAVSRDTHGGAAKSKKKPSTKEDKKKSPKHGREEERGGSSPRRPPEVPSDDPQPLPSLLPTSPARSVSPMEPGYQSIPTSTAARSQPAAQQTVTTIYQTIAEVGHASHNTSPAHPPHPPHPLHPPPAAAATATSSSQLENTPDQSGEKAGPGEGRVTSPSVGEEIVADPNATYAAVEQIKERKRSSRREKERQQQKKLEQEQQETNKPPPLLEEPSDSWV